MASIFTYSQWLPRNLLAMQLTLASATLVLNSLHTLDAMFRHLISSIWKWKFVIHNRSFVFDYENTYECNLQECKEVVRLTKFT